MDDIDRALARLAGAPAPEAIEGLEGRVLAQIRARPTARQAGIGMGVVAVVALAIGMAGGGPPATARAVSPLSPLGGSSALAPSTLLAGTP